MEADQVTHKARSNEYYRIDARGIFHRNLNDMIRSAVDDGFKKIVLYNILGQRYIGTRLHNQHFIEIEIYGTPGNDLGAFMNGHRIIVHGNAQDGVGNTMNSGEIIVHGHAGDILGMSMRGGKIFVKKDVGYRAAIHMKEYGDKRPVIVIGGTAQDFFGEYMAGGIVILLGLNLEDECTYKANFIATGMHSGVIYIRGLVEQYQLADDIEVVELNDGDYRLLSEHIQRFAAYFGYDTDEILRGRFIKLIPRSKRPYSNLYTH